ncbi:NADH-quinone oxidoreductase subunit H [bacterium BMS3Abin07]|nr:NADH-quinone oxidoreductase subunit H [bacterium BMS3Abin07]GBE32468.1 NADH-quinone oxidoreductase subunit H [bacterium BMS3Bbin05]HDL20995.1 NADH-quinone oxidoreductase subunit NuoH [Nitrospirota bacterium]HDO22954.1 NADH-quinone oxidoreductase subunit NuoH [Nitrospirota bacterium]HDZ87946.1 NADH-quinone oxidoreductase subunit NuoH [Nitrospirota bacterium]
MHFFETIIQPGSFDVIVNIVIIALKIVVVVAVALLHVAYATYFERKTIGHMQVRMGPMEVGWHGLLQPIADGLKLFFKEDIIPANADKPVFYLAPLISMMAALASLSVIPFFNNFVIADINIGLLFILAMSSLGAYGVILAGWSSNSKYAFLGGLRSSAQVISYEVPLGLSLVGVMIMAGSLNLQDIVRAQQNYPTGFYAIPQIIGFFVFIVAAFAETNRAPFDLPEAENELVAGYFVEYSGIRFALFYLGEYVGMIIMSSIAVTCFLGGWTIPHYILNVAPFLSKIPGVIVFAAKVYLGMFVYYWVRATLPRYRYDQLMAIGWKVLIPLALLNIVITGFIKLLV